MADISSCIFWLHLTCVNTRFKGKLWHVRLLSRTARIHVFVIKMGYLYRQCRVVIYNRIEVRISIHFKCVFLKRMNFEFLKNLSLAGISRWKSLSANRDNQENGSANAKQSINANGGGDCAILPKMMYAFSSWSHTVMGNIEIEFHSGSYESIHLYVCVYFRFARHKLSIV